MEAVFLLNRVYQPYYKWSFRRMRSLPELSLLAELLEYLITSDNDGENAEEKYNVIEGIAAVHKAENVRTNPWNNRPIRPVVIRKVTVDTRGINYPEPETI